MVVVRPQSRGSARNTAHRPLPTTVQGCGEMDVKQLTRNRTSLSTGDGLIPKDLRGQSSILPASTTLSSDGEVTVILSSADGAYKAPLYLPVCVRTLMYT